MKNTDESFPGQQIAAPAMQGCGPTLQLPDTQCPGLLSLVVQTSANVDGLHVSVAVSHARHGPLQLVLGSQVVCSKGTR